MTTISLTEFRTRANAILKQLNKGRAFVLTYRGKPVARLEPIYAQAVHANDSIYCLAELASDAGASLTNAQIDEIVYGR
jgi:antitoxin (DNA-binding transcriptional repressor) of toxin-antitoxin stability system